MQDRGKNSVKCMTSHKNDVACDECTSLVQGRKLFSHLDLTIADCCRGRLLRRLPHALLDFAGVVDLFDSLDTGKW